MTPTSSNQGERPMSWRKLVPAAVAVLLVAPTFWVAGPASAQDFVPLAPTVAWSPQIAHVTSLYLNFPTPGAPPDAPTDAPETGAPDCSATTPGALAMKPRTGTRPSCTFVAGTGTTPGSEVRFESVPLTIDFNLTANDSLRYQHRGTIPQGMRMTVQVLHGTTSVGDPVTYTQGESNTFDVEIKLDQTTRAWFKKGERVVLVLRGEVPPGATLPVGAGPATWTLSDAGARLIVRSSETLRAATWTTDEQNVVKSLFKPYPDRNTTPPTGIPRIVGHFAVQSAFGLADANGGGGATPEFVLEKDGRIYPAGPQGNGVIPAAYNEAGSQASEGRAVWDFAAGNLDYRGFEAGEYNLTVNMPYHQGGAVRFGTVAKVLISSQAVSLLPYDDEDPSTFPSPLETQAHDLPVGGTTTYLLLLNNTGAVNDTFRIDATLVSGTPAGWAATLGGPGVTDRTVRLAPQESKLVTLTVAAPPGASIGSTSIFQVAAVSQLDPTAKSSPVIVTSTVSDAVRREVAILAPTRNVDVVPGTELRQPIYVWNKGTRPANVSLEVKTPPIPDWTEDLMVGDLPLKRVTLSNVPPGSIASVDLRVTGPNNQPEVIREVVLNATNTDVGGVATDGTIRFILRPTAAVQVKVLNTIGNVGHSVEVNGLGCEVGCTDDGVDGVWFRVWITNSGRRSDTFEVSVDSVTAVTDGRVPAGPGQINPLLPPCSDAVFAPYQPDGTNFGVFYRGVDGGRSGRSSITLNPTETAELYVWRKIDKAQAPCVNEDGEDAFAFVVNVRGQQTGATNRALASVVARDGSLRSAVLLEGVARIGGYTPDRPLVDVSQAEKRLVVGGTKPGVNLTYYVRLTQAASWGAYTSGQRTIRPEVRVVLDDTVDREAGWNVSMRPVQTDMNVLTNPYFDNLTFGNEVNGERQAWVDREIEVVVAPPSGVNNTALAGESTTFSIRAFMPEGTGVFNTLSIKTEIIEFANVTVESDAARIFAHPNEVGAYLLYLNNTGSSRALTTLRASVDPTTPNAQNWIVEPAQQTFTLEAFKNRTLALTVRPPPGASVGTRGEINVNVEYAENPFAPQVLVNKTLPLEVEVAAPGTLEITAPVADTTVAPGGFANYTMTLRNTGSQRVDFRLTATLIPNWTQTISPVEGSLAPGESRPVVYVLKAPVDVTNDTRFASVVRAAEIGNDLNFDTVAVGVNILGGSPIPSIKLPVLTAQYRKTVDRAGVQNFEVAVANVGTTPGRIALTVRSGDPAWTAVVQTRRGENITFVDLAANDLVTLNVSVRAPFVVPANTIVPIELAAEAAGQISKVTLQAAVHDYGVRLEMDPTRLDAVAGLPTEWVIKVRNDGNDNDTLNVSANLADIPDWSVQLAAETLRLEPGQVGEVRAVVKPPTNPLPVPRAYTLKFFAGTRGGQAVNITTNDSVAAVVNVLNYRAVDADRDDFLELAVDFDKNPANGFERFVEVFTEGSQASVVAVGRLNGKASFFLDVPRDRPYDGLADVWYDPETVFAYDVRHQPDINRDNAPDYLVDADRDGKIDRAFDTVSQQFWNVIEIKAYRDDRLQYLVDVTNDGKPDRFFDPETRKVTRTQGVSGQTNLIGIDTDDDQRVDKYYDLQANTVTDAKVYGFVDFAKQYWYFFIVFVAMIVITIVLVTRRRRAG